MILTYKAVYNIGDLTSSYCLVFKYSMFKLETL